MDKGFNAIRLTIAIVSTALQEIAIWAIWRRLLPDFGIFWPLAPMIAIMAVWAALDTWLFIFTTRSLRKGSQAGQTSMLGTKGIVSSPLRPEGLVKIRGELWRAVAEEGNIAAGEQVEVVGEKGLKLTVRRDAGTKH
jgi:membrane-bound ClpP family serine protease